MPDDTTVRVKRSTWTRLNHRRQPGDSFDDVIARLLDRIERYEDAEAIAAAYVQDSTAAHVDR